MSFALVLKEIRSVNTVSSPILRTHLDYCPVIYTYVLQAFSFLQASNNHYKMKLAIIFWVRKRLLFWTRVQI